MFGVLHDKDNMNILIVDDEPGYRMLLEDLLKDEGWTVYTASDGEDGLKN